MRTDSTATSINDLNGKKVCVAKGSTNLDELKKNYKSVIAVPVDDISDCMVLFQQGTVDAVTGDDTVLAGFVEAGPVRQGRRRQDHERAVRPRYRQDTSRLRAVREQRARNDAQPTARGNSCTRSGSADRAPTPAARACTDVNRDGYGRARASPPHPARRAHLAAGAPTRCWRTSTRSTGGSRALRDSLDNLDARAQVAHDPGAYTQDIVLAMSLWHSIDARRQELVTAWDSGRVLADGLAHIATLIWGRLTDSLGDAVAFTLPEACTLAAALQDRLTATLSPPTRSRDRRGGADRPVARRDRALPSTSRRARYRNHSDRRTRRRARASTRRERCDRDRRNRRTHRPRDHAD